MAEYRAPIPDGSGYLRVNMVTGTTSETMDGITRMKGGIIKTMAGMTNQDMAVVEDIMGNGINSSIRK